MKLIVVNAFETVPKVIGGRIEAIQTTVLLRSGRRPGQTCSHSEKSPVKTAVKKNPTSDGLYIKRLIFSREIL